jgi:preprotein translocase subunit SecY
MIANEYVSDAEHARIMLFLLGSTISLATVAFIYEYYKNKTRRNKMRNHPSMRNRKDK